MFKQYLAKQTFFAIIQRPLFNKKTHWFVLHETRKEKKKGIENYLVRFVKSCCLVWHLIKMMNLSFLEIEEILYN